MARKFLTSIDLVKNELQNAVIQNLASAPASPSLGQIYFDTTVNELLTWNGTAWRQSDGMSTGLLSARPAAATANAGTFYYATDNYLQYYSNGSVWQQVAAFGSGASTALTISGTAADGTSTNYARADHVHTGPGFAASTATTTYGLTKADGSATTVARSDHTHGTPALSSNAATNISTTTAANGTGTAPAKDDHVHGFAPSNFALSAFAVPTSAVAFNAQKITGLADPTAAQDAATKAYVDSTAQGLDVKQSVRAASVVAGTLSTSFANGSVIDGVTLVTGDRILIKDQASGAENGIYTVNASGSPTRAIDADTSAKVTTGMFVFIAEGTNNGDDGYVLTTNDVITLGTTALTFTQFSGAGTYTASNGVLLTGSNFTFAPLSTGGLQTAAGGASIKLATNSGAATDGSGFAIGAGNGIVVGTSTISVDATVVARKFSQTLSTSSTTYTVTHSLGTLDVVVQVYTVADGSEVVVDTLRPTINTVTINFATAPLANAYRVVVIG
jgi:hypothetical protein